MCLLQRFKVILMVFAFIFLPSSIIAQDNYEMANVLDISPNARVVKNGDWGLAPYDVAGRRPIITYIPTGLLLFDIDKSEIYNDGNQYVRARTQDGVLLSFNIERLKPLSVFGNRDYMAHKEFEICVEQNCDLATDTVQNINPGNAFSVKPMGDGKSYEVVTNLTTQDDETIGYVAKEKIDRFVREGMLTNLRQKHPRYSIHVRNSMSVDNKCNEGPEETRVYKKDKVNTVDPIILTAFGYGDIEDINANDYKVKILQPYGKKGEAHEFLIYEVREAEIPNTTHTPETRLFLADKTLKCDDFDEPIFIKNVRLIQVNRIDDSISGEFHEYILNNDEKFKIPKSKLSTTVVFEPWGTKDDMAGKQFGRYPYLWSVNTTKQYFNLMDALSRRLSDRSLAGYFLAQYNRSCPKKKRRGRSQDPACVGHTYDGL